MSETHEILAPANERIARLESRFEGIEASIKRVEQTVMGIETMQRAAGKVQWPLIVSMVALFGGLYMAEDRRYSDTAERVITLGANVNNLASRFDDFRDHGAPITDKRLTILETRIDRLDRIEGRR